MNDKFFKVTAVCGHVGRKNGLLKDFALNTNSAEDAAKIARGLPRVKHHNKKAIRQVVEITREEYFELVNKNKEDPYFSCTNIQEQNRTCEDIKLSVIRMKRENDYTEIRDERLKYKFKKRKALEKDFKNYYKKTGRIYIVA